MFNKLVPNSPPTPPLNTIRFALLIILGIGFCHILLTSASRLEYLPLASDHHACFRLGTFGSLLRSLRCYSFPGLDGIPIHEVMLDSITSQPLVTEEGILAVARRTGSIHATLFSAGDIFIFYSVFVLY
jgi:hypothetical protein